MKPDNGLTPITKELFENLRATSGVPHDMLEEEDRYGEAFVTDNGTLWIWELNGREHFIETPGNPEEARRIAGP